MTGPFTHLHCDFASPDPGSHPLSLQSTSGRSLENRTRSFLFFPHECCSVIWLRTRFSHHLTLSTRDCRGSLSTLFPFLGFLLGNQRHILFRDTSTQRHQITTKPTHQCADTFQHHGPDYSTAAGLSEYWELLQLSLGNRNSLDDSLDDLTL